MKLPADIQAQLTRAQNAIAALANHCDPVAAKDALDVLGAELIERLEYVSAEAELVRCARGDTQR